MYVLAFCANMIFLTYEYILHFDFLFKAALTVSCMTLNGDAQFKKTN